MLKIAALAAGLAMLTLAGGANALPGAGNLPGASSAEGTLLQKVHGRHRSCERGPAGWHYHSFRGERVACDPRPRGPWWMWRCAEGRCDWWHRNERRYWR
jgi:hypothetical protein